MIENSGKGNGSATGYAVQEKILIQKDMANIFFLTRCLLMGDPARMIELRLPR